MDEASALTQMPAPGTWTLDPNHTVIGAVARHLMVTKVRGRFTSFRGAIHIGQSPEESWAELEIDAASIDTGVYLSWRPGGRARSGPPRGSPCG